jgi:hypothetical protein
MKHGAVAAEHSSDVSRKLGEIGIRREIDPDKNHARCADHRHRQALCLSMNFFSRSVTQDHQP